LIRFRRLWTNATMSKYVKELMMEDLRRSFEGVRDVVVLSLTGVEAIQDNQMRLDLRRKDIRVRVLRNNLARKVFSDMGLDGLTQLLEGPSAVAWGGQGIVELAKEIAEWASKIEPLQIKGGTTEGRVLSSADVVALSRLPGRVELLGRVVSQICGPGAQLAALVQAPGGRLASQLKARSEQEPSAPAA
jgi:large subunit ribosomal protein L10